MVIANLSQVRMEVVVMLLVVVVKLKWKMVMIMGDRNSYVGHGVPAV